MQLYNTLSAKERTALIEAAGQERLTISFTLTTTLETHVFLETIYSFIGMN